MKKLERFSDDVIVLCWVWATNSKGFPSLLAHEGLINVTLQLCTIWLKVTTHTQWCSL